MFHAEEDPRAPICFVGVGAIVSDDFVRELKIQPHFWLGPELTKRLLRGDSPLLTEKQLRDANSRGGLNQIVWEGCPRREFETHPELYRFAMDAFVHVHRGYLWKEVISVQAESAEQLHWALKTGGLLWDAAADRYVDSLNGDAKEIARKPYVVGVRRKELIERSWLTCSVSLPSRTEAWFEAAMICCSFNAGSTIRPAKTRMTLTNCCKLRYCSDDSGLRSNADATCAREPMG